MGNDQDRLQMLEDNVNAGDSVYETLGIQQNTMRKIARQTERQERIDYYLDEGYPQPLAEEYAEAEMQMDKEEARW
jgi:hypothetical protein